MVCFISRMKEVVVGGKRRPFPSFLSLSREIPNYFLPSPHFSRPNRVREIKRRAQEKFETIEMSF